MSTVAATTSRRARAYNYYLRKGYVPDDIAKALGETIDVIRILHDSIEIARHIPPKLNKPRSQRCEWVDSTLNPNHTAIVLKKPNE